MKIILPLSKNHSIKVSSWSEIKKEALEIREFMKTNTFQGNWSSARAIAHVQVEAENPKRFFVVHDEYVKTLGHWCIVNARILTRDIPCTFEEGCMSFPFRKSKKVQRYNDIKVEYYIPFLDVHLIKKTKVLTDIEAYIFQHEIDHANGVNIYGI